MKVFENSCFRENIWVSKDKTNCTIYYSVCSFEMISEQYRWSEIRGHCHHGVSNALMDTFRARIPPFLEWSWSGWSQITNHNQNLPKGTQPVRSSNVVRWCTLGAVGGIEKRSYQSTLYYLCRLINAELIVSCYTTYVECKIGCK